MNNYSKNKIKKQKIANYYIYKVFLFLFYLSFIRHEAF